FVELVYNGVHVGNDYLCEQIKIDKGRLNISKPYDEEDNNNTSDPKAFGYLMENDDGAASEEDPYFFTKTYIPFIFKDDVDAGGVLKNYVQTEAREIDENLYNSKWDAAFAKMELNSFVDFLLVQELMMNSEAAAPKSCYMYINNGIFHAGPVWDFDWNTLSTTARMERNYSYTKSILTDASTKHTTSNPSKGNTSDAPYVWYGRLIKNSQFKALVTERWDKVKGALSTYANTEIPAMKTKIAASEAVNWSIWSLDKYEDNSNHRGTLYGIGGSYSQAWATRGYCGDEGMTFDAACENLKKLLNDRISGLDQVY
ncbi:MAG: CotH kinase family protein, partial [Alistipes sp.]|nr:CotH kinase family protein [Alistipes sp.]